MPTFNFVLLYVESPAASAAFYQKLLARPPVENSPTFAMFILDNGTKFGLWSRHTVEPAATGSAGAGEIAFTVPDAEAVSFVHEAWTELGIAIAQAPVALDFGFTFVGLDPDGHRLRVFAPGAEA